MISQYCLQNKIYNYQFNAPVCLGSLIYYMAKRKMINPKLLYWAAVRYEKEMYIKQRQNVQNV